MSILIPLSLMLPSTGFPQLSFLQTWDKKSVRGFRFGVKAPGAITHYKKFNDTVLFQLPPRFECTEERLEKIISSLDPSFNNVTEFRHESLCNAEVYKELAKNKISFCGMSHPDLRQDIIQNTSVVYYRMHGVPDLYRSSYKTSTLKKIINEIETSGKAKKAFIYFNNDIDVSSVKNATEMIGLVKAR